MPTTSSGKMPLPRKIAYIAVGILALAMISLTLFQPIFFTIIGNDVTAYGAIPSDTRGWPADDKRGAFLMLNEPHNPLYPGNLLELLATTQPGVVDEKAGAHLLPDEIKALLIQSAALNENLDYRIYRIGVEETQQFIYKRQPGGRVLIIETSKGTWEPGAYMLDVPSDGMFGGRTYYQFYVDSGR